MLLSIRTYSVSRPENLNILESFQFSPPGSMQRSTPGTRNSE